MENQKYARKCIYMPLSSSQSQFSIMSLVALKLKLKNYVCVQSPIAFENILEGTFLHMGGLLHEGIFQ